MTDLDALLKAILANPECDTARLVYADRLEERGEKGDAELAGFIRLQCCAGYEPDWGPGKPRVRKGEHAYEPTPEQVAHRYAFLPGPKLVGWDRDKWVCYSFSAPTVKRVDVIFRRGFVDELACSAADCIKHLDAIRARHPVTRVRLTTWPQFTVEWSKKTLRLNGSDDRFNSHSWDGVHGPDTPRFLCEKEWPDVIFDFPEFRHTEPEPVFSQTSGETLPDGSVPDEYLN